MCNVRKSAASESKRKSNGGDDDPYKSVSKKAKPVSKSFPLPTLPSLPKPIKKPKCFSRPKNRNLSKHLQKHARGGGNLGVCMTRIERKKNWRKKSRTWRTLKSAQRKQLLKHYEIFLRQPLVSVCENFAGDMFSWLPSIFIFPLLKNILNFWAA